MSFDTMNTAAASAIISALGEAVVIEPVAGGTIATTAVVRQIMEEFPGSMESITGDGTVEMQVLRSSVTTLLRGDLVTAGGITYEVDTTEFDIHDPILKAVLHVERA